MKEDNTNTINMVENHIRTLNVIDDGVLDTLKKISRRSFVPEKYKAFAHVDMSIPIGFNQKMLLPSVEAKILQAMDIKKSEDVLLVGSGTGYFSTCISELANRVHSIDVVEDFIENAKQNCRSISGGNMYFEKLNILDNLKLIKNYKVTIFTTAIDNIDQILDNMDNGARCFIFENVANFPIQKGMIVYKTNKSSYLKEYILETNIQTISTGE
jgi:protein-L-isoaspartate(D-aspartate) O-methyltransferase